ncbi:hypothetical protein Hanom_Chr03g00240121 [Helianthus anomalus]
MISFNNLVQEYDIKPEWHPVLPSKKYTTFPLRQGKITLFSDFFKFCNSRLPITKFCKSVLDEYQIHISQMHPLGLVKLYHFEFACIALGHIPEIIVFRAFFILVWKSPFFTFDRRDIGVSCLRNIPTSSRDKDWNKKFFYFDASVIAGEMHWREMGAKDKFKDDGPPVDAYIENALFKRFSQRPSECTVISDGALVMAGMSLLWRNSRLYPAFQSVDEAIPDKDNREEDYYRGATTSPVTVNISAAPEGAAVTSTPTSLVSPQHAPKWRRMMPPLTAFQATKATHTLHAGSFVEAQVEGGSSMSLSSSQFVPSAAGGQSVPLADLISQASVVAVSYSLPPPLFTIVVVMIPSSVTTPLFPSSTPVYLFDSLVGDFFVSRKEMPTTSTAGKSTSAKDTTVSDTGGSSGCFVDDGARLSDDLHLPTVCWDPYAQDKCYQPKWKIAQPTRLVPPPPVVHHWVERAYLLAESIYVEGLDNENLINATMVDVFSQPRRLAEI